MRSLIIYMLLGFALVNIFAGRVVAQGYVIAVVTQDSVARRAVGQFAGKKFSDSTSVVAAMNQAVSGLVLDGYLLAGYEQLTWKNDTITGRLVAGDRHTILFTNRSGGEGKPVSPKELVDKSSQLKELSDQLNNGYPFARLYVDQAKALGDTIWVTTAIEKGPLIRFDTLALSGHRKTRARFLQKFLFVTPGTPYSERAFRGIASRINSTGYLRTTATPGVAFYTEKAGVSIRLEELPVNQIDGVLGFLPDQNAETGRLLITGQIETDLFNLFGTGKHFYFNWQNFNIASQKLVLAYDHPVILGSPIDFHGSFQQLKQDSTFVNRSAYLGFSVPLSYLWRLNFGVNFRRNNLLSTEPATSAARLQNADSKLNQYGAGLSYAKVDDVVLPSSGLKAELSLAMGQKEITVNNSIGQDAYDDIRLSSLQTTAEVAVENYRRVFKSSVFVQQLYAGSVFNPEIFQNDLFRLGGLSRLRGFNENQFYVRHYTVGVLEWRLRLQEGSYLLSFADQSVQSQEDRQWRYAVGFGGGMVIKVNNGLFRLMVAWGVTPDQPFDFSQPKVHFGFVNRF